MTTYSIGLMIKAYVSNGARFIDVNVMKRAEDGRPERDMSPLNASLMDDDKGYTFDGLKIHGHVSSYNNRFNCHEIQYGNVYAITESHARAMVKTLAKINAAIKKAEASEPGDIFLAFGRAIGAKWVCETTVPNARYSSYADVAWRFRTLSSGRDCYREIIRNEEMTQQAEKPIKAA